MQGQLVGCETFDQVHPGAAQLIAHRRIDVGVAARYLVAASYRQLREAAHECAADTQNVNVHVAETR